MIINNEMYPKVSKRWFADMAAACSRFYNETNRLYDEGYMSDRNPMVDAMDDMVRYMDELLDPTGVQPWFSRWIWGGLNQQPCGSGCTVRIEKEFSEENEVYFDDVNEYYDFIMQHLDGEGICEDI